MELLNRTMDRDAVVKTMQDFFAAYEAGFNRALADSAEINVEATAGAFADCFTAADRTWRSSSGRRSRAARCWSRWRTTDPARLDAGAAFGFTPKPATRDRDPGS